MAVSVSDQKKTYEEKWNPIRFLEQYISERNPWERNLLSELHKIVESGKIKGSRCIDIGCGPTLHRMAILARACDEILVCDFTSSNLEFLKKWFEDDGPAGPISDSLQSVARLEGFTNLADGEKALFDRLRSKVKHIAKLDITDAESVNKLVDCYGMFDCGHSNAVLESACLTYQAHVSALRNINSLLKPGAAFIFSGYLNGTHYVVDGIRFYHLTRDVSLITRSLKEAGFQLDILVDFPLSEEIPGNDNKSAFWSLSYKI